MPKEKDVVEALGGDWEEVVEVQTEVFMFEKEGDELVGVLTEKREDVGENSSMLYRIEKLGGEVMSVWGSTVLDDKMSRIETGQEVKIVFLGLKKTQSGNRSFKSYAVYSKPVKPVKFETV